MCNCAVTFCIFALGSENRRACRSAVFGLQIFIGEFFFKVFVVRICSKTS